MISTSYTGIEQHQSFIYFYLYKEPERICVVGSLQLDMLLSKQGHMGATTLRPPGHAARIRVGAAACRGSRLQPASCIEIFFHFVRQTKQAVFFSKKNDNQVQFRASGMNATSPFQFEKIRPA